MTSPFVDITMKGSAEARGVRIWMAGDYDQAKQVCREYCSQVGACFALTKTDYVYSGGEECGFCIYLINYARFPTNQDELVLQGRAIGDLLLKRLNQGSYSLEEYGVSNGRTRLISRRSTDS